MPNEQPVLINPLNTSRRATPAGETAAQSETAFSVSQASGLQLQDVTCGEYNRAIPALVDVTQRIVIPVNAK